MGISKANGGYFPLFLGVALLALVARVLLARATLAQPVDAGEEPAGAPVVYNLTPAKDATVAQDKLSRAAATVETQRDATLAWVGIFVDGRRRPAAVMGPTSYLQTVSADIGYLGPGTHTIKVKAVDSAGRAGGYAWTFTVV